MKIFGEEYGFALTVGASAEIADLCPDGGPGNTLLLEVLLPASARLHLRW